MESLEKSCSCKFGEFMRELRVSKGLSQKRLSSISGVNASYIYKLETGIRKNPSALILHRLAKALGVEYEDLIKKLIQPEVTVKETEE